jgi:hypothetical protein
MEEHTKPELSHLQGARAAVAQEETITNRVLLVLLTKVTLAATVALTLTLLVAVVAAVLVRSVVTVFTAKISRWLLVVSAVQALPRASRAAASPMRAAAEAVLRKLAHQPWAAQEVAEAEQIGQLTQPLALTTRAAAVVEEAAAITRIVVPQAAQVSSSCAMPTPSPSPSAQV